MPLNPALIVNQSVPLRRTQSAVSKLLLHVQHIGVITQHVHRTSVAELPGCKVGDTGLLAQLFKLLPDTPSSQPGPAPTAVTNEQGINFGWQWQTGAGFKPAAEIFSRVLSKDNRPFSMGLGTPDKSRTVVFPEREVINTQRGQFTDPTAGVQCQGPQGQGPDIEPPAFALIGFLDEVAKEPVQFRLAGCAGNKLGLGRRFGVLNRVGCKPTAFDQPGQPDFKTFVVGKYAAFLEAAPLTVVEKTVDVFGRGRPGIGTNVSTEEAENALITLESFQRLAGFGLQELLNGPIQGAGVVKLNQFQGRFSHHKRFAVPLGD